MLPDAEPNPYRSPRSRYKLADVGKNPGVAPSWVKEKKPRPQRQPPESEIVHPKTKFPFKVILNGEEVTVWPDWIERKEADA